MRRDAGDAVARAIEVAKRSARAELFGEVREYLVVVGVIGEQTPSFDGLPVNQGFHAAMDGARRVDGVGGSGVDGAAIDNCSF